MAASSLSNSSSKLNLSRRLRDNACVKIARIGCFMAKELRQQNQESPLPMINGILRDWDQAIAEYGAAYFFKRR